MLRHCNDIPSLQKFVLETFYTNTVETDVFPAARTKTYDSGDSLLVTHEITDPPVNCLSKDDRTGIPAPSFLWSYVPFFQICKDMLADKREVAPGFVRIAEAAKSRSFFDVAYPSTHEIFSRRLCGSCARSTWPSHGCVY